MYLLPDTLCNINLFFSFCKYCEGGGCTAPGVYYLQNARNRVSDAAPCECNTDHKLSNSVLRESTVAAALQYYLVLRELWPPAHRRRHYYTTEQASIPNFYLLYICHVFIEICGKKDSKKKELEITLCGSIFMNHIFCNSTVLLLHIS